MTNQELTSFLCFNESHMTTLVNYQINLLTFFLKGA